MTDLPVELVEVQKISVRGCLGPMTVYFTNGTFRNKNSDSSLWTKVHDQVRVCDHHHMH